MSSDDVSTSFLMGCYPFVLFIKARSADKLTEQ